MGLNRKLDGKEIETRSDSAEGSFVADKIPFVQKKVADAPTSPSRATNGTELICSEEAASELGVETQMDYKLRNRQENDLGVAVIGNVDAPRARLYGNLLNTLR